MIFPPLDSDFRLPDVSVTTDQGHTLSLRSLTLSKKGVTVLLPGFTTCHGTCPVLVQLYKRISTKDVSIVFFSFDPDESTNSLAMFREHSGLDANWTLIHASLNDTQKLLTSLQYTVMKGEAGFQHPAQAFVFTKDLQWIGSLYGTNVSASEFVQIVDSAHFHQNHPYLASLVAQVQNPNTTAIIGGGGFLIGLVLVLWMAAQRMQRTR